jgi:acyl-CoA synthetase (AMP-forming)/AMP-acid ligase II
MLPARGSREEAGAGVALRVGEIFRRGALAVPGRVAATLGERELRYGELDRSANRLAHALRGLGVRHGDRIVSWTDTCLEVLPLFAAAAKLGAVFAPMNARIGPEEAAPIAGFSRARCLVADAGRAEAAAEVAQRAGIPLLAHLGGEAAGRGSLPGVDLAAAAARASDAEPLAPELAEDDPHVLFFTSGSTGRPKGVLISHRVSVLRTLAGGVAGSRQVCMFPLFHMAGFTNALGQWRRRGQISFVPQPTAEALLREVERRHPERLYCIPAVWARILECDLRRYDLTSLEGVDTGTSATPPELIRALKEAFPGTTTNVVYGSTEAGPGATLGDEDVLRKPGSVGLPALGVEARLGEGGELLLRSDFLMSGYFDDPGATAAALADGWYHTGDVASVDEEGYLSIVGRVRDIIRTGGETVAPPEVEEALRGCPGVAEVAVVGLPDPRWGEIVCAVVVPAPGAPPTLEALRAHAAGRLAAFKQPRRLELVSELPRTPATRQVQRALLVERLRGRA